MKILHIGGTEFVVDPLVKYQREAGHEVVHIVAHAHASNEASAARAYAAELRKEAGKGFDAVLFHTIESLPRIDADGRFITDIVIDFQLHGSRVGLYLYGLHEVNSQLEAGMRLLPAFFDVVFCADPARYDVARLATQSGWVPLPADVREISAPAPITSAPDIVRFLFVDQPGVSDATAIVDCLMGFAATYPHVQVETVAIGSLGSTELAEKIAETHVLVEHAGNVGYGPLAAYAMACGVTVVSGDQHEGFEFAPELRMTPILGSKRGSLLRRIETVAKQPLCLKDLSQRSRTFAEQHHDAKVIAARISGGLAG